jgi:hypothetical protein
MMKYSKSLKAESTGVRANAPWRGGPVLRWEPQEQARRGFAARTRKRDQKNVNTGVAIEAKALGGGGGSEVEVPAALVAVTAALRKMAKLSEN